MSFDILAKIISGAPPKNIAWGRGISVSSVENRLGRELWRLVQAEPTLKQDIQDAIERVERSADIRRQDFASHHAFWLSRSAKPS